MRPDASDVVYAGSLFDVVRERWGEHEREIVDHPGAVAVVAVDTAGRVALVRQRREAARAVFLELPAGTAEPGEAPEATARRELAEETGLSGGAWRELAAFWTTPGFCRERMHLFLAEGVRAGEASPDADERVELVLVPAEDVEQLVSELEDAKTLAGLLLYLRDVAARGTPTHHPRRS